MMSLNPDSSTEMKTYRSAASAEDTQASATKSSGQTFKSVKPGDKLSSSLVGLDVYNKDSKDVGKIADVAIGARGIEAYILSVGGFLGMGDHYVAVTPSTVSISYNSNDQKWR